MNIKFILIAVLVLGSSFIVSVDAQYMRNVGSDAEYSFTMIEDTIEDCKSSNKLAYDIIFLNKTHYMDNKDCKLAEHHYFGMSSEDLEEIERRRIDLGGANPIHSDVLHGPLVTSVGQSYDTLILVFLIIGISISFILGMIYWWKKS